METRKTDSSRPNQEGKSRPQSFCLGLRVFVPGWSQWALGERSRARVLGGTFVVSLAVGLFAWGSIPGLLILLFAILTHITSVAQATHVSAFPGFGIGARWFASSFGIGLVGYGPLLVAASHFAMPVQEEGIGYLVNRCAFESNKPSAGDLVWVETSQKNQRSRTIAVVIATEGDWVEYRQQLIRVNGEPRLDVASAPLIWMSFEVPPGELVIADAQPESLGDSVTQVASIQSIQVVPVEAGLGRAWARTYPVWSRRLFD